MSRRHRSPLKLLLACLLAVGNVALAPRAHRAPATPAPSHALALHSGRQGS